MTTTADPARHRHFGSWARAALLLTGLFVSARETPAPWSGLWFLVPAAVMVSLLAGWRFGTWSVFIPVALFVGAMVLEGPESLWVWWIPAASLTGVWMGLREEGGGPSGGARAWMLLPLLLLAAGVPWSTGYPQLLSGVERELHAGDVSFIGFARMLGPEAERVAAEEVKLRSLVLPHVLPSALFVWMALLVGTGRSLAGRAASVLRWPRLSRPALQEWRLPDGAVWVLLAGLAMLVAQWGAGATTAWTLLLNAGLGYCIQGIAVVESLLLARGVSPPIIVLTMVFVFVVAWPVFATTALAVGLSDVWLDFRRIEPRADVDKP